MPKQPPGPGDKSTNTKSPDAPIYQRQFSKGATEPTKNYVILEPQTGGAIDTNKPAILLGSNGKLYLRSDLMPKDGSAVKLTVTAA